MLLHEPLECGKWGCFTVKIVLQHEIFYFVDPSDLACQTRLLMKFF